MAESPLDPLLLGQRVVAILETGLRTATYKLATLTALIDHSIENLPDEPDAMLRVPVPDLAHRVLELYWPQVRPFQGHLLQQIRGKPNAVIPRAARELRAAAHIGENNLPVATARIRAPEAYEAAIDQISLCLAQEPLPRLQRLPGAGEVDLFLYDDRFLQKPTSSVNRARGYTVELNPGVAQGLARLAGLLKPALEIMWVDDVRRMNKSFLDDDAPDVAGHLFGRDRVSLAPVRGPFKEAFGPHCFYCREHLRADSPIDHVLPWSLVGMDGLANLVLACTRCNTDKRHALPAVEIVNQVLGRDRAVLEQIAAEISWPTQYERVVAAACGIYRGQAPGAPTWAGYQQSVALDISHPQWWIRARVDSTKYQQHVRSVDRSELIADILARLVACESALSPADFLPSDDAIPRKPGLYSWWVDAEAAAILSAGLGLPIEKGLIYVGLAGATRSRSGRRSSNTLRGRIHGMHLGGRHEFSTFRRSLGSILAHESGTAAIDEDALTAFMFAHLRVIPVPVDDPDILDRLETEILTHLDPPLNLAKMSPTPCRKRLTELRRQYGGQPG